MAGEGARGQLSDAIPSAIALLALAGAWALVQNRDGSWFVGMLLVPPVATGMLSSAAVRSAMGPTPALGLVASLGVVVFAAVFGGVTAISNMAALGAQGALEPSLLLAALGLGVFGAMLGAVALTPVGVQEDAEEDEATEADDDIDYRTEPEQLVCLLTNQTVTRKVDRYVVCHNRLNQTQVCHAVYLAEYVHLLQGRCRRCYQPLRRRDLEGRR